MGILCLNLLHCVQYENHSFSIGCIYIIGNDKQLSRWGSLGVRMEVA